MFRAPRRSVRGCRDIAFKEVICARCDKVFDQKGFMNHLPACYESKTGRDPKGYPTRFDDLDQHCKVVYICRYCDMRSTDSDTCLKHNQMKCAALYKDFPLKNVKVNIKKLTIQDIMGLGKQNGPKRRGKTLSTPSKRKQVSLRSHLIKSASRIPDFVQGLRCDQCDIHCHSNAVMDRHLEKKHNCLGWVCNLCDHQFDTTVAIKGHFVAFQDAFGCIQPW